jgi:hypothetical protein
LGAGGFERGGHDIEVEGWSICWRRFQEAAMVPFSQMRVLTMDLV